MNYLSELFLSAIKLGSWKLQKKTKITTNPALPCELQVGTLTTVYILYACDALLEDG